MGQLKEYEQWMEKGDESKRSYAPRMPHMSYAMPYGMRYSGHSTRDRMVSALEDIMGEAKNEYEASMISDAIAYIQNGR